MREIPITGWPVKPKTLDDEEFMKQVMAEPNEWSFLTEAYPIKAVAKNEAFPRPHEVYNCTTCNRGGYNASPDQEKFFVKCRNVDSPFHGFWNRGKRWNDIDCKQWARKEPRPRKGYLPGVEI